VTVAGSTLLFLAALVTRLPGFVHQLFDPDEAAIATMGMVLQRGGTLYRDVIDRKPPLAPFVYAASFLLAGTRDLRVVHAIAALGLGLSAIVLAIGARRVAGARAGWWAGGLLVVGATALSPVNAQSANFSNLALLPACGAIVAARWGTRRSAVLAGILLGIATLTRQSWVIGIGPAAYAAWWWGGRRWSRVVVVVSALMVTVGTMALLMPFGPFWHWTFAGNGAVLALDESEAVLLRGVGVLALCMVANVATCWLVARRGWRRGDLDLWLWAATGLVAFVAGFRFFGHYWLQVLPPLCLLAGLGVVGVSRARRRALVAVAVVPAVAAWCIAFVPEFSKHADLQPLARYVRAHTGPDDLVTVWGSGPEVYWISGRAPGGALITTDFVVGRTAGRQDGPERLRDATPGALDAFLAALHRRPPLLFLDTSTAGVRDYQHYPLTRVPAVAAFVLSHYTRVAVVQGTTVYRLNDLPR
jgi:4-amino-4-deoxy-L-arabinose transferase-like glycosyltransferase